MTGLFFSNKRKKYEINYFTLKTLYVSDKQLIYAQIGFGMPTTIALGDYFAFSKKALEEWVYTNSIK